MRRVGRAQGGQNTRHYRAGHHPRFALCVKLGPQKEEQCGEGVEPVIQRVLEITAGNPPYQRGTQIVQSEQAPAHGPQQQVGLPFQVVDIREKAGHQRGRRQQSQRNEAFVSQGRTILRRSRRPYPLATIETKPQDACILEPCTFQGACVRFAAHAARLRRTKQSTCVRLWLTDFSAGNRTSVLVAKETGGRGSTTKSQRKTAPARPVQGGGWLDGLGSFRYTGVFHFHQKTRQTMTESQNRTTSGVRVRFAPSPTGYLHVWGARTALFNWLFVRQQRGTMILRIEDTDAERNKPELVQGIIDGLTWLGVDWGEGPFYQYQRTDLYREAGKNLLASGAAFLCYCPAEKYAGGDHAEEGSESTKVRRVSRCT